MCMLKLGLRQTLAKTNVVGITVSITTKLLYCTFGTKALKYLLVPYWGQLDLKEYILYSQLTLMVHYRLALMLLLLW